MTHPVWGDLTTFSIPFLSHFKLARLELQVTSVIEPGHDALISSRNINPTSLKIQCHIQCQEELQVGFPSMLTSTTASYICMMAPASLGWITCRWRQALLSGDRDMIKDLKKCQKIKETKQTSKCRIIPLLGPTSLHPHHGELNCTVLGWFCGF